MGVVLIEHWTEFAGAALHRVDAGGHRAYAFLCAGPPITAQGAPDAYHPDDTGSGSLHDSGWPSGAWRERLVPDPHQPQRPLRQSEGAQAGYFVSTTALADARFPRSNPQAYVDAGRVPYLAMPATWLAQAGAGGVGDFVVVHDRATARSSFGLIGDAGRGRALGEMSERMASDLSGVRAHARSGRGAPQGTLLCVVFPGSRREPAWPLRNSALRSRCEQLLRPLGGVARLAQLADSLAGLPASRPEE
ncbi:hypothetical protein GLE_1380 [Lysobacter enzymogenes]|uniref:Uncharacterized protein n=1 Tax=Lysobacter enzymogenes TaxID=69 RepID=A0A0S2DE09_LYSEN|nr:glycoside hydrolase family 75 protein [Lysobacter enzymogenes]ALN56737.1 hypothetical protein GLE_1380 [Lysobacter enzymogenes]QCW25504.1 hypothetical protein FE772_07315 [Lysobacter enzymogenes]